MLMATIPTGNSNHFLVYIQMNTVSFMNRFFQRPGNQILQGDADRSALLPKKQQKEVAFMKFVIQVVSDASVTVDGKVEGQIGQGYMVLVGVGKTDDRKTADKMIRKLLGLRIFPDENGKTNLSLKDVQGSLLMISQFTLYADTRHGNRPGFTLAGSPDQAQELYQYVLDECRKQVPIVEQGVFGAHMQVRLTNEGPFTIVLDSDELK